MYNIFACTILWFDTYDQTCIQTWYSDVLYILFIIYIYIYIYIYILYKME